VNRFENMIERLGIMGYAEIEPAILTCWAMGWPLRLSGPPGTAKTMLASRLSAAENGRDTTRILDCTKENLMTIAGMPDMEAAKRGIFKFIHETEDGVPSNFIWGMRNLVFNEFTRITTEFMNHGLEVLQERTLFGLPLEGITRQRNPNNIHYSIMATENPEGEGVRIKMDSAILDRFNMLVNVPNGQGVRPEHEIRGIVTANLREIQHDPSGKDPLLTEFARRLRRTYGKLMNDTAYRMPIEHYCSSLWNKFMGSQLSNPNRKDISDRRKALFTEAVLGFAAYRIVTEQGSAPQEVLKASARDALNYVVVLPKQLPEDIVTDMWRAHETAAVVLGGQEISPRDRFVDNLNMYPTVEQKIDYLIAHEHDFRTMLDIVAREKIMGDIFLKSDGEPLLGLRKLIQLISGHEELMRRVNTKIVLSVSTRMMDIHTEIQEYPVNTFDDLRIGDRFMELASLLAEKPLNGEAVRLILEPNIDSQVLISRLIDTLSVQQDIAFAA